MASKPKPRGFGKFDRLMRGLVKVPREAVAAAEAARPKRKRRKKK